MVSAETGHPVLTDERTGLPNRLQFETVYRFLFYGADRGVPLTLMMVQMDASDESAFVSAAHRIASSTRSSDLLSHLGDGRFVTLLLGCNLYGARIAADRVSAVLGSVPGTRFAIGLAAYRDEMQERSELLDAAARALDEARAAGGGEEIGVA
jgi:GGDEF domain-containing protein